MGEKWDKILDYIENYRRCYANKNLDYYQIFNLSKEMNPEEIAKTIKDNRLAILFHPDWKEYVPREYRTDFEILTRLVVDMKNTLCNLKNKKRYDEKLALEWQKRWDNILHYIETYRRCYANKDLNYYHIFEIPSNKSAEEIARLLDERNLKGLFNFSYKEYVSKEYLTDFINLTNLVLDMEKNLCNKENKERYDTLLDRREKKKKENQATKDLGSNIDNDVKVPKINIISGRHNKTYDFQFSNVSLNNSDKREIDEIISRNIKKYGFQFAFSAICDFMFSDSSKGFTRDNDVRRRIEKIGKEKLYTFLKSYSDKKDFSRDDVSGIIYYFNSLVLKDKELYYKMDNFISASTVTFDKYNYDQLVLATRKLIEYQEFSFYTNDHNVRKKVQNNVNRHDGKILAQMYLSSYRFEDFRLNYKNLEKLSNEELSYQFSSFLSERISKNKNDVAGRSSRTG